MAFDTTALALVLSILLMFAQFLTSRVESVLLEGVDDQVAQQLVGRFEELGTQTDPTLGCDAAGDGRTDRFHGTIGATSSQLVE